MTETKNLKLKTYETTTDGQELVARYIDNTSDNFQKIDEFCKTDTTLSVEGGIADAKTVGDNVSQLKEDLDNQLDFIYNGGKTIEPILIDGFVRYTNGSISENGYSGVYKRTDYISIPVNCPKIEHNFVFEGVAGGAFFDVGKNFISGISTTGTIIEIPNNARYIILTNYNSSCIHTNKYVKVYASNNYLNKSRWKNKIWITLGDSITARNWYQPLICEETLLTNVNYGVGGTTIAKSSSNVTDSFIDRYQTMQDECDIISVWGGVNDWIQAIVLGSHNGGTNVATFYGALKVLIEGLITKYPNKKIFFFTTPQCNNTDDSLQYYYQTTNSRGNTLAEFNQAVKDVCGDYAIPVLDMYIIGGLNQLNINSMTSKFDESMADGLHPSRLYFEFNKYKISEFIEHI